MPTTKRRRRYQRPADICMLEALISGPRGNWTPQQNAEIERHLERNYPTNKLIEWRKERQLFEKVVPRFFVSRAVFEIVSPEESTPTFVPKAQR